MEDLKANIRRLITVPKTPIYFTTPVKTCQGLVWGVSFDVSFHIMTYDSEKWNDLRGEEREIILKLKSLREQNNRG